MGNGKGNGKGKKKGQTASPVTYEEPLSLQTLCILHLDQEETQMLEQASLEFLDDLRQRFRREVREHPVPLPYNVSPSWLYD